MKAQSKLVKSLILGFLVTLILAACSPAGAGNDLEPGVDADFDLSGTSWVLTEYGPEDDLTAVLPDTTITLNFADDGINGSAGCNSYFGEATQSGSSLTFGPLGSTLMACAEPVMQQENEFLAAMASVSSFTLAGDRLTLRYEDGTLLFIAGTEEVNSQEAELGEETKTLFVGPELVDCVGVAPQQCLQVKESQESEWTLFYDQIIGFTFEPGFEYELLVREAEIENPPADGSSIQVTLVEIVNKTAVPTPLPEGGTLEGTRWILSEFGPDDSLTAVLPQTEITLNFEDGQINGSAGCNSYFAEVTVTDSGLSVGLIGSTLMACVDDDISTQEADFLAALGQVTEYTQSDYQLTLKYDGGLLIFEAHEAAKVGEEVVDWQTAVAILKSGDVVEIFQTHSLDVTLTLVDGRVIKTVEPGIDDIFTAVQDCGQPCSNIMLATE